MNEGALLTTGGKKTTGKKPAPKAKRKR